MNNMEKMLETASKKLNMSSEELKTALGKGDLNAILANMNKDEAKKLQNALSNPEIAKKLSETPEASEYMKEMKRMSDN